MRLDTRHLKSDFALLLHPSRFSVVSTSKFDELGPPMVSFGLKLWKTRLRKRVILQLSDGMR